MSQDALEQGNGDAVDAIVDQWRRERPDLDPSAKEVTGRIVRLAGLFQAAYAEAFAPLDISEADYGILAPLRRAGAPYALTPTELARQKMMTSGGMTAAIDRLVRKGLVIRNPNPADRRGSLVRLTDEGLATIDEAMELHTAVEQQLTSGVTAEERNELARRLRGLLLLVEP
ncbi:MAG: MarR family winged helix-turn-helix transcriptional regulator [Acidimicrobiales bacterium]